jgi:hypothetical protein
LVENLTGLERMILLSMKIWKLIFKAHMEPEVELFYAKVARISRSLPPLTT